MSNIKILVEGPTEILFVNEVLKLHFYERGIYIKPFLFQKAGGVPKYSISQKQILNTIRSDPSCFCTTMVDFYGMPTNWPGREQANRCQGCAEKADMVEGGILKDIAEHLGNSFNPLRIVPYVQMHEFEALLFSDVSILANKIGVNTGQIEDILNEFGEPEEIDDGPDTAPSKRLISFHNSYRKVAMGKTISEAIGIPTMREKCPHFDKWLTRLEQLGGK